MSRKTALVLSAGGMFGAYQAGAWKVLSRSFRPDIVIGASIGALNGWAIAGGIEPEELIERWLDPVCARFARLRMQPPWRGVFDSRPLYAHVQKLWAACRPKTETGIVVVEIPALRPRLFRNAEVGWQHLAASCAVLPFYPQIRIDGRLYIDGGLLGVLPVWAAAEMGATRIVAINALPRMPSRLARGVVGAIRKLAPWRPPAAATSDLLVISPAEPLGSASHILLWRPELVQRWIALGERDAARLVRAGSLAR